MRRRLVRTGTVVGAGVVLALLVEAGGLLDSLRAGARPTSGTATPRGPSTRPGAPATPPDRWLALRARLAIARAGAGWGPSVHADRAGVVVLSGRVEDEDTRHRAEHAAWGVAGVGHVHNGLTTPPRHPTTTAAEVDEQVAAIVRRRLGADPSLAGIRVGPYHDGLVELYGRADLGATLRAISVALGAPGVQKVASRVMAPQAPRGEPSAASWGGP